MASRTLAVVAAGLAVAVAASIVNLGVGPFVVRPSEVVAALVGELSGAGGFVVRELRLPRNLVGFGVGATMALSGTILQGIARNPLAAPELLGVTSGANLGAVATVILATSVPVAAVPAAAFGGGLVAALVVYVLAWNRGVSPARLVLVGIGVAAAAHALVTTIVLSAPVFQASTVVAWMAGSLYGRTWTHLGPLTVALALLLPVAVVAARRADALALGDDLARGLGVRTERDWLVLLLVAVALAAAAVATAGPIPFVGLVAPHAARLLVGPSHGGLLAASAVLGGLVVVVADVVGRTLFAPVEIPAGLVTAAIGVPYFLVVLQRRVSPVGSG
jgi:iron complex transport system permease protein